MSTGGRIYLNLLLLVACCFPVIGWGAWQALQFNLSSPVDWVPDRHPAKRNYLQFTERFETGDVVVASWPGCTVDDPRLKDLAETLRHTTSGHDAQGKAYFDRILTGYEVLRELTAEPLNLSRDEALRRLRGTLVGADGKTTCAVVSFLPAGVSDRARAVRLLRAALEKRCGIPPAQQHLAGPVLDGLTVDAASADSLNLFAAPSAVVILLLGWWCLGSARVSLMVFGVSLYCEIATLALVHYCGDAMTALLIVMPPLILVIGVSNGIHLVNYYYNAIESGGEPGAAWRAVRFGWLPCTLSAGTTAIGLASLLVSDLVPIRAFGLYASSGVMLTLVLLFVILPGGFAVWPVKRHCPSPTSPDESTALPVDRRAVRRDWYHFFGLLVARWHWVITIVSLAVMGWTALGIPKIETSVKITTLLSADSRELKDYAWIEKHVGPLVPIEVVLQFAPNAPLTFLERLELVGDVQQELARLKSVDGVMSAATFAPTIPSLYNLPPAMVRAVVSRRLENSRQRFVDLKYLQADATGERWRITARVSALNDMDYGEFLSVVRQHVEPVLETHRAQGHTGVTAGYTGVMPLVHDIQRELMHDLFASFLSAFVMITGVMMLVQRGIVTGLIAMLSNVFPMVLMFGTLGWIGRPMDIGSVMTASVALGMAIDGTLHFLTFFRQAVHEGQSPRDAVEATFHHCAPAMIEGSMICALGLLVFAGSSFLPTSRFAWMIFGLVIAALIGDLVVLPALLVGPLGRLFIRQEAPPAAPPPLVDDTPESVA